MAFDIVISAEIRNKPFLGGATVKDTPAINTAMDPADRNKPLLASCVLASVREPAYEIIPEPDSAPFIDTRNLSPLDGAISVPLAATVYIPIGDSTPELMDSFVKLT